MTIKRLPEDFHVEEVLTKSLLKSIRRDTGRFAFYRLEKSGIATPDAVLAVCRQIGVPVSAATYAGLKDKHALTIQHLAVNSERVRRGPVPRTLDGKGWSIELLGYVDSPLDSSSIAANRFHITVRGLSSAASARMNEAAERLAVTPEGKSAVNALRVVNYFGDQRFGSSRHLAGFPAKLLIQGDYEGALRLAIATEARKDNRLRKERSRLIVENWSKWSLLLTKLPRGCPERAAVEKLARGGDFRAAFVALPYFFQRMTVQAYQSYLWNETARELVEDACGGPTAMFTYDGRFGKLSFPPTQFTPPDIVTIDLPVLGYKSELAEPWKASAERVLAREGIGGTSDLRIRGVRRPFFSKASRRLFVDAVGFELTSPEPDATAETPGRLTRKVSFDLPRGAYATVVLRALGQ